jgi:hypothetical protein
MKMTFWTLFAIFLVNAIKAQEQTLILIPGKKEILLDTNGKAFFELNEQYEFINSDISFDGNGYHKSVVYSFNGFPLLVKKRGDKVYQLLDKNGETKAWLPSGLKGVAPKKGGFYLASKEVDEKIL